MSTVTILWARHGQNVANISRTLSHRVFDGDLTDTGRRQAAELADRLAATPVMGSGQLICSPLRRARQTAQIIGERLGLPVARELDELRELNVGALDGRNDPAAWDTYGAVLAAWQAGKAGVRFPEGEDYGELCARLRRALAVAARMRLARPRSSSRMEPVCARRSLASHVSPILAPTSRLGTSRRCRLTPRIRAAR